MRPSLLLLTIAAAPLGAQAVPANSGVATARAVWMVPHGFVVRALTATPDSLLNFRAAPPPVRTLGELFAHIADGEHLFCSLGLGETMMNAGVEERFKSGAQSLSQKKAALLRALTESAEHCDKAYAQNDAGVQGTADFFGRAQTRLWLLTMNGAHTYEHYGNIVTYMRAKGLTPPSSGG